MVTVCAPSGRTPVVEVNEPLPTPPHATGAKPSVEHRLVSVTAAPATVKPMVGVRSSVRLFGRLAPGSLLNPLVGGNGSIVTVPAAEAGALAASITRMLMRPVRTVRRPLV